jgi:hypothetical protein
MKNLRASNGAATELTAMHRDVDDETYVERAPLDVVSADEAVAAGDVPAIVERFRGNLAKLYRRSIPPRYSVGNAKRFDADGAKLAAAMHRAGVLQRLEAALKVLPTSESLRKRPRAWRRNPQLFRFVAALADVRDDAQLKYKRAWPFYAALKLVGEVLHLKTPEVAAAIADARRTDAEEPAEVTREVATAVRLRDDLVEGDRMLTRREAKEHYMSGDEALTERTWRKLRRATPAAERAKRMKARADGHLTFTKREVRAALRDEAK